MTLEQALFAAIAAGYGIAIPALFWLLLKSWEKRIEDARNCEGRSYAQQEKTINVLNGIQKANETFLELFKKGGV